VISISARYGYTASICSLVWAVTKGASDREGAFDVRAPAGDGGPGVNDVLSAWHNGWRQTIAIEQHFYRCLFKLLQPKNV